jgi:hypothetical protein
MQVALQKRHAHQLQLLQNDITRQISTLSRMGSARAPSPRTMSGVQAEHGKRLKDLMQRQSDERLHLAETVIPASLKHTHEFESSAALHRCAYPSVWQVARQEETLLRSKNQQIQHMLEESLSKTAHTCQRHGLQVAASHRSATADFTRLVPRVHSPSHTVRHPFRKHAQHVEDLH